MLYTPLPNIIRVTKPKRMRWVQHVANMGRSRDAYRVLVGRPDEKNYLEDSGLDGRIIIIKRVFKKWDAETPDRLIWQAFVNALMQRGVP
jgi:hypothetical protein